VFQDWIPVSQYHACIASDELLPLHPKNFPTSSHTVIHVQSPTPDFKYLNHSVIARCCIEEEIEQCLYRNLDVFDAMHRPGTCAAVLQSCTPSLPGTKKGAQSPDQEPSLSTVLENDVGDSILEDGTLLAQSSCRASRGNFGRTSKNTQVCILKSPPVAKYSSCLP
jgi:hypothetical protein